MIKETSSYSEFELKVMKQLIALARKQKGKTSPNPVTAAAVIKGDKKIAQGVHQAAGKPHAEVLALRKAGSLAKGATLIVNLEPCTHHGQTPPCTDAIIQAGIKRVVYAMTDPNPEVRKIPAKTILEKHGIEVVAGLCDQEADAINEVFIKNQVKKMPFVILKAGMSLDGKIALKNGESHYITCEESLKSVHKLRREVDAILVGINTVTLDNPQLNVRFNLLKSGYRVPKKIILDPHRKLTPDARLIQDKTEVIVLTKTKNPRSTSQFPGHVRWIECPFKQGRIMWENILKMLYKEGITSLLIEGGEQVFTSVIDAGVVDKGLFYVAPKLLGGKKSFSLFSGEGVASLKRAISISNMVVKNSGSDIVIEGYFGKNDNKKA